MSIPQLIQDQSLNLQFFPSEKKVICVSNNLLVMSVLQKNARRLSGKTSKFLLYQVLSQHLIKTKQVIHRGKHKIMIKKKEKYQNCRITSSLNTYLKILSKTLVDILKKCLFCLVSSNQTAYVQGRSISEEGRLVSQIIKVTI